jgi:predicted RNA binding protein YcfA (HicA-like mRNA interferase family)
VSPRQFPVVSGAQVVRALEKDGFRVVGTKGSHCKLRNELPTRTVIVPLHDELRTGTLASICRQAGITADRLRELL